MSSLNEFILASTPAQRARASEIAVINSLANSGDQVTILRGCYNLQRVAGISTVQYKFVAEIEAFVNYAVNHKHYKNKTIMYDDLLRGETILFPSYH